LNHEIVKLGDIEMSGEPGESETGSYPWFTITTNVLEPINPLASSNPAIELCNGYIGSFGKFTVFVASVGAGLG
jgi:hypothetical protein